jgi:hypothetical protein
MSLSSITRFLPAAPPRQIVRVSDALFFTRAVAVTAGASAAEVAVQAELAIETLAPFPVAHLFYGHYCRPGADHALIYAAYRKRFTADELAAWSDAELVLPRFAAMLNSTVAPAPATAVLVPGLASVTGLYFADGSGVPTQVRVQPLPAEPTAADHAAARADLLAAFPEKLRVEELAGEPEFDPASPQGEFVFRAGEREMRFDAQAVAPLDVRDKDELAARRRAHARDVILWRSFLGCAAAIALCALLEFALVGTSLWQARRLALEARQKPVVEAIMTSQQLATRIEELSNKRLLPFEMLALVNAARPPTIQFTRSVTKGLYTLEVEAHTQDSGDIDVFRSALNKLAGCQKAEVLDPRSRDGVSTFKLVVTFRPEAFKQAESAPMPVAASSESSTEVNP